ncbi:tumor protein D52-like isoform X1 [Glandiceps talaboti]
MREKKLQDTAFAESDLYSSLSSISTCDEVTSLDIGDEYDEYNTAMDLELTTTLSNSEQYLAYLHHVQSQPDQIQVEDVSHKEEPLYDSPTETQPLYDNTPSPTSGSGDETLYTNPELVQDEAEKEALHLELTKTEEEIATLKQVLTSKEKRVYEIKRKLGLTPLNQFSKNMKQSWSSIQQSSAYQSTSAKVKEWNDAITGSPAYLKTNEKFTTWNDQLTSSDAYNKTKTGLSSASQKTGAAFSSFGSSVSKKMGELKNSTAFKSIEEKTTSFASTVKQAVVGQPKQNADENSSFEDVLNSTAQEQQKQQDEADRASPGSQPATLPEEKVPL